MRVPGKRARANRSAGMVLDMHRRLQGDRPDSRCGREGREPIGPASRRISVAARRQGRDLQRDRHLHAGIADPKLNATSQVADRTVLGAPIALDGLVGALTNALQPLGYLVDIKINEKIPGADSLTVNALHVKILRGNTGTPVADVVVAQSKVGFSGAVCDKDQQGDTTNTNGICPPGSVLDSTPNVCVIRQSTSGSSLGDIIVGKPYQGPSGGTVVPIDIARKKYGRSPCLGFSGAPKFAIVGTNKADRITGSGQRHHPPERQRNQKDQTLRNHVMYVFKDE